MSTHVCQPPVMAVAVSRPEQPDWTCAVCGRVWRDTATGSGFAWVETRGPRRPRRKKQDKGTSQ